MKIETSRRIKDDVIMILTAMLMAAFFSFVFYRQAIMHNQEYLSDLPTQIYVALNSRNLSFLYFVMKKLLEATDYFLYSIGLFEGFLAAASWVCASLFIERHFKLGRHPSMMIALGLQFLTTIMIPVLFKRLYAGSVITQPWHNISYFAMRPFAILAMYFFVDLYRIYRDENRISRKHWIWSCLMLLFATLMQPSFLMVFALTLLGFLIFTVLKKQNTPAAAAGMGCMVLPALVPLFIELAFLIREAGDEPYRIAFGPSPVFFTDGILPFLMKWISGLCLPALVFWHNRKTLTHDAKFVGIGYLVSLFEAMLLYETGKRQANGSFMWGMSVFAYLLFLYTVPMFLKNAGRILSGGEKGPASKPEKVYLAAGTILILLHILSGGAYYYWIMKGNYFYV